MAGEWIPLQASLIKTKAFFAVGGFNPHISGPEDIDLLRRIALEGDIAGVQALVAYIVRGEAGSTAAPSNRSVPRPRPTLQLLASTGTPCCCQAETCASSPLPLPPGPSTTASRSRASGCAAGVVDAATARISLGPGVRAESQSAASNSWLPRAIALMGAILKANRRTTDLRVLTAPCACCSGVCVGCAIDAAVSAIPATTSAAAIIGLVIRYISVTQCELRLWRSNDASRLELNPKCHTTPGAMTVSLSMR